MQLHRSSTFFLSAVFCLLSFGSPASAQSLGIGARLAMVRGDVRADPAAAAQRFTGGQIRAKLSSHTSLEVSLDMRSEDSDLTHRVKDYPLQGSILLFPVRSTLSPYVLGGLGWYTHIVDTLAGTDVTASEATRKVGYHAGFGAEVRLAKHASAHADYRYTFVHFGDGPTSLAGATTALAGSAAGTSSLASHFLPSYDGSMWTAGVTFYF